MHIVLDLEVVDHHGSHGGGGAEDGACCDQDVNVFGLQACGVVSWTAVLVLGCWLV